MNRINKKTEEVIGLDRQGPDRQGPDRQGPGRQGPDRSCLVSIVFNWFPWVYGFLLDQAFLWWDWTKLGGNESQRPPRPF